MVDQDLNVADPEQVAGILRNAAQAAYEAAGELESAWQDKSAGRPWKIVARELERCAFRIEERL